MVKKITPLFLFISFFTRSVLAQEINYHFPYPGILPDHPLYPLKIIRDKIYDFFLLDKTKKTEFKLLMADKRFYMAVILFDKGKPLLAETSVSKASKYYQEGVLILSQLQKEEKDLNPLKEKFIQAGQKYQQIITGWQKTATPEVKQGLQLSLELIKKYQKELTVK